METNGNHIFRQKLIGRQIDYQFIRSTWANLSDEQISSYATAIPKEWTDVSGAVKLAISLIKEARDKIDECLKEVKRVLT